VPATSPSHASTQGRRTAAPHLGAPEWDELAERVCQAAEIARQHGLQATFHLHAGTWVESRADLDELLRRAPAPLVKLCWDVGHAVCGEVDPIAVVRTIQRHGINVIGNFIFGLRDDTLETMKQTLHLALECLPDFANFYSCMAYPGSALYTQAIAENWTLPSSWRGFSQHNDDCRPLDTEHVGAAEVLRFRDAAFRIFFNDGYYRAQVERKFGAAGIAEIDRMLKYHLPRKLLTGEIK